KIGDARRIIRIEQYVDLGKQRRHATAQLLLGPDASIASGNNEWCCLRRSRRALKNREVGAARKRGGGGTSAELCLAICGNFMFRVSLRHNIGDGVGESKQRLRIRG